MTTAFPQQPENIRPILDAFLLEVRRWSENETYLPPPVYRKKWVHGARELIQVLKADPWLFMPWAFKKYNKAFGDSQRPESPGSLVFLVSRYKDNRELCRGCGQVPEYCLCEDYEPDGSPKRRMPASMKNWWPDADAADPPDREE